MNSKFNGLLITTLLMLFSNTVCSQANIVFKNFWVVNAPAVAQSVAAYGLIQNTGTVDDTLLKVSSDTGMVMLHQTQILNGRGNMQHLEKVIIKAGQELALKPMSYHLMFANPNKNGKKLKQTMQFTFYFKQAGVITITAPIKNPW